MSGFRKAVREAGISLFACVAFSLFTHNGPASAESLKTVSIAKIRATPIRRPISVSRSSQVVAYLSTSTSILNVLEPQRTTAAAALGATIVSNSQWLVPRGPVMVPVTVVGQTGPTLQGADDPKDGDVRIARDCKCTGNAPALDSGCQAADIGSQRMIRIGYSYCQTSKASTCSETYTAVVTLYSYIDTKCQQETARRTIRSDWVCLP